MIADAINSALADVWAKAWAYLSFSFLDPFWGWLSLAVMVAAVVFLVVYFFGSWMPQLRAIGGVILLIITFGLIAYRRGESDAREHDRKRRRK